MRHRQLHVVLLAARFDEATREVVGQRCDTIERAGVQPDSRRPHPTRFLDGLHHKPSSKSDALRAGVQAEIHNFGAPVVLQFEFKKSSGVERRTGQERLHAECTHAVRREIVDESRVGPCIAIVPMVRATNVGIQSTPLGRRRRSESHETGGRFGGLTATEVTE